MKYIAAILMLLVCLFTSCRTKPDFALRPELIIQVRNDSGLLTKNSTVELVSKGPRKLYDKVGIIPLLSPSVKLLPEKTYEIGYGARECTNFWVLIHPDGNIDKSRKRHPVFVLTASPYVTMSGWSEWLPPDFEAEGQSHWIILDEGDLVKKLPISKEWPEIRYRMVVKDISNGFPGIIVSGKIDD